MVGVSLWARHDTTQVMLGVSLRARFDTTLVDLMIPVMPLFTAFDVFPGSGVMWSSAGALSVMMMCICVKGIVDSCDCKKPDHVC